MFGLPLPLFAFALVLSIFGTGLLIKSFGILPGLFFGLLLGTAVFKPLQLVHKNDLQAWQIWLSVIKNPRYSSEQLTRRKVLIQTQDTRCLDFRQWRKTQ